jgi:hypothetical protein
LWRIIKVISCSPSPKIVSACHTFPKTVAIANPPSTNPAKLQSLLAKGPRRSKGKKAAVSNSTAGICMKGTIYLWVLAAVLSGALVGLLGFVVKGLFNVQSPFMEPVIIGAIAGAVAVLITIALFRNGK